MTLPGNGQSSSLRADIGAGLVVFLVALPLGLGIALASGAPLMGGLIAGVVGGLVVGILSGSEVSVSGPSAGLTLIVFSSIEQLGSYQVFLAAVVIAGVIQLALAALRLGVVAEYVPTTVIKGMLSAIGLAIILKQIPHALGRDADFEGDLSFLEHGGKENTLSAIAKAVLSAHPGALIITGISLAILVGWDKVVVPRLPRAKAIPAALVVVILAIALNETFKKLFPALALQAEDAHLVSLPTSFNALQAQLTTPAMSAFLNVRVYTVALTIAVVGSLETLLSLEASEKLDPLRRFASPTRELFAQGTANILSGLIGGLPITSVVVRTSANVYAGARTRWASIVHAAFLALAILLLPSVLIRIPLAGLAALLIVVGVKLAPPSLFRAMWNEGWTTFLPFILTVLGVLFTDLLKGVVLGLLVGVFLVMRANHHAAMTLVSDGDAHLLRFNKDLTFVNKAELKANLATVPAGASLTIDATRALYLDRDIFDVLDDFIESVQSKPIEVELKNFKGKRPNSKD